MTDRWEELRRTLPVEEVKRLQRAEADRRAKLAMVGKLPFTKLADGVDPDRAERRRKAREHRLERRRERMNDPRRVRPLPQGSAPEHRRMCVIATPCGGSRYTAETLQASGIEVGHEVMFSEGICGGMHFLGLNNYAFERYEYDVVVRLIRHPLRVLTTLPFIWIPRQRGVEWAPPREGPPAEVRPGSPADIELALRWWVLTHEKLRGEEDYLLRVYRLDEDLDALLAALSKVRVAPENGPLRKPARLDPPPTWEQLMSISPEWTARARAIVDYYELPEP